MSPSRHSTVTCGESPESGSRLSAGRVSLEHYERMLQEMHALLQGGNRDPGDENASHGDPVTVIVNKTTGEGYVVDLVDR